MAFFHSSQCTNRLIATEKADSSMTEGGVSDMGRRIRQSTSRLGKKISTKVFFGGSGVAVSSAAAGELVARQTGGERLSARERLFLVLTEPSSSKAGAVVIGVA